MSSLLHPWQSPSTEFVLLTLELRFHSTPNCPSVYLSLLVTSQPSRYEEECDNIDGLSEIEVAESLDNDGSGVENLLS